MSSPGQAPPSDDDRKRERRECWRDRRNHLYYPLAVAVIVLVLGAVVVVLRERVRENPHVIPETIVKAVSETVRSLSIGARRRVIQENYVGGQFPGPLRAILMSFAERDVRGAKSRLCFQECPSGEIFYVTVADDVRGFRPGNCCILQGGYIAHVGLDGTVLLDDVEIKHSSELAPCPCVVAGAKPGYSTCWAGQSRSSGTTADDGVQPGGTGPSVESSRVGAVSECSQSPIRARAQVPPLADRRP